MKVCMCVCGQVIYVCLKRMKESDNVAKIRCDWSHLSLHAVTHTHACVCVCVCMCVCLCAAYGLLMKTHHKSIVNA